MNSSPYEMPVLMIVNEVYFRMQYDYKLLYASFEERLLEKYEALRSGKWYVGFLFLQSNVQVVVCPVN